MNSNDFFKDISKKFRTPQQVQKMLRAFPYNHEKTGETLRSAKSAYQKQQIHCLEAALLAAALLEQTGFPPLVMSLESIDNLDHVVFVYQKNGKWGSIGRSRDEGLHGRKPIFRSLRDLALSYYEPYIDNTGCIIGYQVANLDHTQVNWRSSSKNVWAVEKYLIDIKHIKIKFNQKRYNRIHKKYQSGSKATKKASWL